jgi:hypothetical protein
MNSEPQFSFNSDDLGLLGSVLNEVLNGFNVPEFDRRIGMKRADLEELLARLHDFGSHDAVTLDTSQTRAFRNALFETIKELGVEEFHTRTGYDFSQGNAVLKKLDRFLGTGAGSE